MPDHKALAAFVLCVATALAAGSGAWAADPSGTAVAVVQASEAIGAAGTRMLVARGPVYMGDTIRTGASGEAQIQLADDTRLVVGPNSLLVVDAFVFDRRGKAKQVALNAVRGAFRFITGGSRKSAYKIVTPTATIGVRGTEFDFSVDRGGQLNFALFEGQARICSRGGRCTVLSGACSVAVIPRSGAVRRLPAGNQRTGLLRTKFPYIASQRRLNRMFRVDTSSCGVRRANILPDGRTVPTFAERIAPGGIAPPGTVDPGVTGSVRNHSGLADLTNPGRGSANNNASGGGTNNPGGSSNGGGGGAGNAGGNGSGGGNGNGNSNGHNH